MAHEPVLIGLDGGATEAKAHAVACDDLERPTSFELRSESAARVYMRIDRFTPVAVGEQFTQRDADDIRLTEEEVAQGSAFIRAAADAIIDVARQCSATRMLVGAGMPGLKTADGRGINVINNGPRMPDYLTQLEKLLEGAGLTLDSPIAALGSDADYCGLGEQYAADGLFRDVENAYYVGCGTGIADALKLRGKLVAFDDSKPWIQKSWQMPSSLGPTFEKLISAKSLNDVYENMTTAATQQPFPERAAIDGDPLAIVWLDTAALMLAELIFERLWTIKNGRPVAPHRGDAYAQLDQNHAYHGTQLDRVVIGQRLGQIYGDAAYRGVFSEKVDTYLAAMVTASDDKECIVGVLASDRLNPGWLQASNLRAAPALGAAIAAVQVRTRT